MLAEAVHTISTATQTVIWAVEARHSAIGTCWDGPHVNLITDEGVDKSDTAEPSQMSRTLQAEEWRSRKAVESKSVMATSSNPKSEISILSMVGRLAAGAAMQRTPESILWAASTPKEQPVKDGVH